MRIAIISFRTFEYGGVERYAYELVNHLAGKAEVHLFTNEIVGRTNAEVHLVPAIGKKDLLSVNSFMFFLKKRLKPGSFDIIHSMGPLYLHSDVITAHICQKRLLSDDLLSDLPFAKKSYWNVRTRTAANFQRLSFSNARRVIAVSSMLAGELKKQYRLKIPTVLYPGIEKKFFTHFDDSKKRKKREDLKIRNDATIILFVGSQWERKGLKYAIEAFSHITTNSILMIYGKGNKTKYKRLAKTFGVESRIIFGGFTRNIIDVYPVADMLILPSLYEPFGYPVLEAMAMGLPVVVTSSVGASEIIEEGKCGYVVNKAENVKALFMAINKITRKGSEFFEVNVKEKARQFLWENNISKIISLYEEVIEEKKRANKQ